MVLPDLPGALLVLRAFEIATFVRTKHATATAVTRQIKHVINHIIGRAESPWPPSSPPWPQSWAVDETVFRRDLTSFEFNTLYILRYLESTPTPSDLNDITEEIPRDNLPGDIADGDNGEGSSRNPPPPPPPLVAGFSQEQMDTLTALIRSITNPTTPPPPANQSQREWKADDIGFFDPSLNDPDDTPIVTVGRHSFYRDVYSYVDRLKDLAKQRSPNKLRTILPECFRSNAQIWYSIELGEMEKDLLRSMLIEK